MISGKSGRSPRRPKFPAARNKAARGGRAGRFGRNGRAGRAGRASRLGRKGRKWRTRTNVRTMRRSSAGGGTALWANRAYAAGTAAAAQRPPADGAQPDSETHRQANASWNDWHRSVPRLSWPAYHAAAAKFAEGYFSRAGGRAGNRTLVPTARTVAAIVTVMNEKDSISGVLEQLHRLPLHEMIFIVNGSTDESFEMIRNQSRAMIVHYTHPLGHDVGRAIGAKLADSDILLFLDGDFPIAAEQLIPFIHAVDRGTDVALNDISPYIGIFSARDQVTIVKEFVNRSMRRTDLGANSLTAVPHAMSKQAARLIGYANLAVPPKAQAVAIDKGLKVGSPASVDVFTRNRVRAGNIGRGNDVAELIVGDHIEALRAVMDARGPRLSFTDLARRRQQTRS